MARLHSIVFNDGSFISRAVFSDVLPRNVLFRGLWLWPGSSGLLSRVSLSIRGVLQPLGSPFSIVGSSEGILVNQPVLFRGGVSLDGMANPLTFMAASPTEIPMGCYYVPVGVRSVRRAAYCVVASPQHFNRSASLNLAFDFDLPFDAGV